MGSLLLQLYVKSIEFSQNCEQNAKSVRYQCNSKLLDFEVMNVYWKKCGCDFLKYISDCLKVCTLRFIPQLADTGSILTLSTGSRV